MMEPEETLLIKMVMDKPRNEHPQCSCDLRLFDDNTWKN